jgi:hypothetical protein
MIEIMHATVLSSTMLRSSGPALLVCYDKGATWSVHVKARQLDMLKKLGDACVRVLKKEGDREEGEKESGEAEIAYQGFGILLFWYWVGGNRGCQVVA